MGLSLALNNALSGLNVNQQSLSVLSQNIANANTPGYSKQSLNQQSVTLDGNGSGVTIQEVRRKVDEFLVGAVRLQNSSVGQSNVVSDYNDRVQLLLGKPGSQNNISAFVGGFFNALQSLAQTPQDVTLQQNAVSAAVTLAAQFQQLGEGLQSIQFQADQDIRTAVTNVNNDLQSIYQLNSAIVTSASLGKSVGDLQDKRDTLLQNLSQYMDIKTFSRENGSINITSSSGISLLDDSVYRLDYTPQVSANSFSNGSSMSAITVTRLDSKGLPASDAPAVLVTGGTPDKVVSTVLGGQIRGLLDIRDQQVPDIINQIDTLAAGLRDQVNKIHNTGTGFPGANSYTGTRPLAAQDASQWSGSVRVAVLDSNGKPVASPYGAIAGIAPLTIDLSKLDTGSGAGRPSVQGIVDEINQYYGIPQNKAQVGNLDNIRLVSDAKAIPGAPPQLSFDFDLSNRAADGSTFFVSSVQVKDDAGTDITSISHDVPTVALTSYVTNAGSSIITVNSTLPHGLSNGDTVFLSSPTLPSTIDDIPIADFGGYFTVSSVTANSFQITLAHPATVGNVTTSAAGQTLKSSFKEVAAGQDVRTNDNNGHGVITASLTGHTSSQYYTVTANVAVKDSDGNLTVSQVSYRINNQQSSALNHRFSATALTGGGTLVVPDSTQVIATAMMVDANGKELPKVNGEYTQLQQGYLAIKANGSTDVIAIDSLDSVEQGKPNSFPVDKGTNRAFSHYFGLNDLFVSNQLTTSGDTIANSALNMKVTQRLQANPSYISLGSLTPSATRDANGTPSYTYERASGDNSVVQQISSLSTALIGFSAAGGLAQTTQSFNAYAGAIIGVASTRDAAAKTTQTNAQTLMDGFSQRATSISGVNLDTELANTVIYQNAYSASARIITVTSTLFDSLLQAFR